MSPRYTPCPDPDPPKTLAVAAAPPPSSNLPHHPLSRMFSRPSFHSFYKRNILLISYTNLVISDCLLLMQLYRDLPAISSKEMKKYVDAIIMSWSFLTTWRDTMARVDYQRSLTQHFLLIWEILSKKKIFDGFNENTVSAYDKGAHEN